MHLRRHARRLAIRGLAATLALVAFSGLHGSLGAQPAVAAEPGLVTDSTWFPSEDQQVRTAAAVKDSGSRWVRLGIGWHDFEPAPGVYNAWSVSAYRKEFERARAAGQRIIVSVATSPAWASGTLNPDSPPKDPADYARFIRYLSGQYGEYVDGWEIWNEPNFSRFWPGGPDPKAYTALLKAAYPAVKAGDPTSKVLFGGLSTNDYAFVEAAYAAGAKGSFDVMATHPYACQSPETITREADGRMKKGAFPAYRELRASMLARGDDKPIWFTEFGWSTTSKQCGVSEATQADYLRRAFEYIKQDPYVEVATWYNFRNNFYDSDADGYEARFGLMRTDFTKKPAYSAFKTYAESTTATTPPPTEAPPAEPTPAAPTPAEAPPAEPTPAEAPASPSGTPTPTPAPSPEPGPGSAPAPTVRLTAPAAGATFSTELTMAATAGKTATRVEFLVDGKVIATDIARPYEYRWRVPKSLSYANHALAARTYDAKGLSSSHSSTVRRERQAGPAKRSRVTLRVAEAAGAVSAASNRSRSLRAWGRVSASGISSVRIRVLQQAATGWRTRSTRRVKVRARRFNVRLGGLSAGRYRVEVILPGPAGAPLATRNIRL